MIQLCTAKIPRQRTVRAAYTRISASGCSEALGRSPALERSAVCQFPRRSPRTQLAAEMTAGPKMRSRKTIRYFTGDGGRLNWCDQYVVVGTRSARWVRARYQPGAVGLSQSG